MAAPHDELADVRELADALVIALDDGPAPQDAAALELLALTIQAPFTVAEVPPEIPHELAAALGRRGDELAADLLAAIERFAAEPLAGLAADERARLERLGIAAPHVAHVGTATVAEAYMLSDGAVEIWLAVLRRPGSALSQPIVVSVGHEPCGAVVLGIATAEPQDDLAPHELLDNVSDQPVEPLGASELQRRLREALAHMERHDVPLDIEAARALPLLERALTGRAGRLPRPPVEPPDPDSDPDEDEDAELHWHADALVEAFATVLEQDEHAGATLRENGPFVAHCMLDWKIDYGDGRVERWTLGDLRELLLDWFPRKVTADEKTVAIAAEAVSRFLRFLAEEELLEAPIPLTSLEAAVQRLRPRFEHACRDRRRWGPAKSLVAEMEADGVDLRDEHEVSAWIDGFNARVFSERSAAARARAPAAKRAKRKATRRARRRNRH